jgi:hypothetical protein
MDKPESLEHKERERERENFSNKCIVMSLLQHSREAAAVCLTTALPLCSDPFNAGTKVFKLELCKDWTSASSSGVREFRKRGDCKNKCRAVECDDFKAVKRNRPRLAKNEEILLLFISG